MGLGGKGSESRVFRGAFRGPGDEHDPNQGKRPVVFDVLAPDKETSILPENLRMVLLVNPSSLTWSYTKVIERIQTKGGFVEQHWGEGPPTIAMNAVTGGFKRLYSGLSNVTGGGYDAGGTRRETLAYERYLDLLALFHNNGSVYDSTGQIVFQGILKMTFDGGTYLGWFTNFNVNENADKPFMFDLSASFQVDHESHVMRSMPYQNPGFASVTFQSSKAETDGKTSTDLGKDFISTGVVGGS